MIKTTLKNIKEFNAENITYSKNGNQLYRDLSPISRVAYSTGVYGMTGLVIFSEKTKKYYKITSRTSNLFIFN